MHYEARADISIFHKKGEKLFVGEILTDLTENFSSWKKDAYLGFKKIFKLLSLQEKGENLYFLSCYLHIKA